MRDFLTYALPLPMYSTGEGGGAPAPADSGTPAPAASDSASSAAPGNEPDPAPGAEEEEDYEYEGEKYRVPKKLAEHIKKGTLAERDYRFKTGEVSETKRALQAEREEYQRHLKTVKDRLTAMEPPKPDAAMLDPSSDKYDRDEYYRRRDAHDAWTQRTKAAEEALSAETAKNEKEAKAARAERLAKEDADLLKKVPAWKDEAKRAADVTKIGKFAAAELGVTAKEFSEIDDHRVLVALRESMLYREGLKRAAVAEKEADKPKPLTVKRVSGGGNGASDKLSDRQDINSWMKARNSQVRGARA